ncbi:MAG: hypothetical protein CL927_16230 [Deltaproteobacteria bacterium]|nr:hypothetical protein [Deltaproteobacteria bacterium]HCH63129.1 hypothetical protein [Deltaproteobacteria bacterium]
MAERAGSQLVKMFILTGFCVLGGMLSVAEAASRVVFQLADPTVDVYLDQQAVRPTGAPNKRTVNHVSAGEHTVVIQQRGQELGRHALVVPDGANVTVRVSAAGSLEVSGATASSLAGPAAPPTATSRAGGHPGAGASALAAAQRTDRLAPEERADSFDMNEGGGKRSDERSGGDQRADFDREKFNQAVTTTGRVVGGAVAPGRSGTVVAAVTPMAAESAVSVARSAKSIVSQGSPGFRQGRPVPPQAETGTVAFICPTQDRIVVYLEGFVIARVGPASQKAKSTLEVGRHKLEFLDVDTGQYIYRGVVEIEKNQTITLEIGDAYPPKALDRDWSWSLR